MAFFAGAIPLVSSEVHRVAHYLQTQGAPVVRGTNLHPEVLARFNITDEAEVVDLQAAGRMLLPEETPLVNRTPRGEWRAGRLPVWANAGERRGMRRFDYPEAMVVAGALLDFKRAEEQYFLQDLRSAIRKAGRACRASVPLTLDTLRKPMDEHLLYVWKKCHKEPDAIYLNGHDWRNISEEMARVGWASYLMRDCAAKGQLWRPQYVSPITGRTVPLLPSHFLPTACMLPLVSELPPWPGLAGVHPFSFEALQDYFLIERSGAPEIAAHGAFVLHAPELQGLIEFEPAQ